MKRGVKHFCATKTHLPCIYAGIVRINKMHILLNLKTKNVQCKKNDYMYILKKHRHWCHLKSPFGKSFTDISISKNNPLIVTLRLSLNNKMRIYEKTIAAMGYHDSSRTDLLWMKDKMNALFWVKTYISF